MVAVLELGWSGGPGTMGDHWVHRQHAPPACTPACTDHRCPPICRAWAHLPDEPWLGSNGLGQPLHPLCHLSAKGTLKGEVHLQQDRHCCRYATAAAGCPACMRCNGGEEGIHPRLPSLPPPTSCRRRRPGPERVSRCLPSCAFSCMLGACLWAGSKPSSAAHLPGGAWKCLSLSEAG